MLTANGLVIPLGVSLVSVVIVVYLRYHIKKNFFIAKIASTKVMSIYLIFCILIALSVGNTLFEITHQEVFHQIAILVITITLLIGICKYLFFPTYRTWKKLLTSWVGNNPEGETIELRNKIDHLEKKIRRGEDKQNTLSAVALKVDAMYYNQKLDSIEKSRSTARFMNIFVIVCPAILFVLEIVWIWLRW